MEEAVRNRGLPLGPDVVLRAKGMGMVFMKVAKEILKKRG